MPIVTWEYYSSPFSKVSQNEFSAYEGLAEKEVRQVIGLLKWETITVNTYGYEVLKDCICNVIDKIKEFETSGIGKGITSVSNDGYTETYSITNEVDLRKTLASDIKGWLSGTGLVGAY